MSLERNKDSSSDQADKTATARCTAAKSQKATAKPSVKTTPAIILLGGEAQPSESFAALQACNDYLSMGAGRSLSRLQRLYITWNNKNEAENGEKPTKMAKNLPEMAPPPPGGGRSVEEDVVADFDLVATTDDLLDIEDKFPREPPPVFRPGPDAGQQLFTFQTQTPPPTTSRSTLKEWSGKYDWRERARIFDAQRTSLQAAEHKQVMNEGLALPYNRVELLKRMAGVLIGEAVAQDQKGNYVNLWLRDVKTIGAGDSMEAIVVKRYNSSIVGALRGVFDDIARESGGRQTSLEVLIREMPWERLPEKFARRMISENPREVLMDMIEELARNEDDSEMVDGEVLLGNDYKTVGNNEIPSTA